ncbi:Collagen alpha-2(VI) chain [Nibea albiflora]|uniref:Collagen alpha-2(VI) chain n=1 Tax=Nibea albiflora TaxID=240163 RepID=A0ACB7EF98_NIBAL|nr:Collagen alpha-2(VI) chain [Nibea albiflora]
MIIDCPIKVFFAIDTSETIALQESPPGALVNDLKEYTKTFAQGLNEEQFKDQVKFSWSIGGLDYSQTQDIFSEFTTKANFIRNVNGIIYKGKGTFTDCALRRMAEKMTQQYSGTPAVLFSVFITDGHVTGSPCGGMKAMSEKAEEKGIHIFAVAATNITNESGMDEIASSPREVYRYNYTAVTFKGARKALNYKSIERIIQAMKHQAYEKCYFKHTCYTVPGPPGVKGYPGQKGTKGDSGPPGSKGEKGKQGDPGIEGPIGPPGPKGPDGFSGDFGDPGTPGENGTKGDPGAPGRSGPLGPKGNEGPKGEKGYPGNPGPPGTKGSRGRRGDIGIKGGQGTDGNKGDKGERGPMGNMGPPGEDGNKGSKGSKGSIGDPGPFGDPGTLDQRETKVIQVEKGPGVPEVTVVKKDSLETKDPKETMPTDPVLVFSLSSDCEKHCGALDIVFVIDSSESVGMTNFTLEKNFVINTINRLGSMASDPMSPTGTRVGVVQYSHNGTFEAVRIDDPTINSMSTFKTAVKNLQWIAGGTFTPSALKFAYDHLIRDSKRARAKISVVVVTDGRFDPRDDEDLTYLCNFDNVVVNAIGVGDMFKKAKDDENLLSIACNNPGRVTEMKRYVDLVADVFIEEMETVLCPEPEIVCPELPCNGELHVAPCVRRPVDLVFLLDGSERLGTKNFGQVREFLQKVSEHLQLAHSKTDRSGARLALIEYGTHDHSHVAFALTHNSAVINDGIARPALSGLCFERGSCHHQNHRRYLGQRNCSPDETPRRDFICFHHRRHF